MRDASTGIVESAESLSSDVIGNAVTVFKDMGAVEADIDSGRLRYVKKDYKDSVILPRFFVSLLHIRKP